MTAYYNEIDPYAAQWLRNLIDAGHIAPGVVDDRSIEDVKPADLVGFAQCHFFAGIGIWSLALRMAGWPDNKPVWTGSCPCQPFSTAGKGAGFDDERHLWPHFQWLIQQCRPPIIFGEQVASKDANTWIDLVQADVEAMGYSFGCVPFPSASVGAPHIRDRNYWVGHSISKGLERHARHGNDSSQPGRIRAESCGSASEAGSNGGVADTALQQRQPQSHLRSSGLFRAAVQQEKFGHMPCNMGTTFDSSSGGGPVNGFWRAADWLHCRDGKWRPVEPGTFPLANGDTTRVGRLRAYGNAINAKQSEVFIKSVMECVP